MCAVGCSSEEARGLPSGPMHLEASLNIAFDPWTCCVSVLLDSCMCVRQVCYVQLDSRCCPCTFCPYSGLNEAVVSTAVAQTPRTPRKRQPNVPVGRIDCPGLLHDASGRSGVGKACMGPVAVFTGAHIQRPQPSTHPHGSARALSRMPSRMRSGDIPRRRPAPPASMPQYSVAFNLG